MSANSEIRDLPMKVGISCSACRSIRVKARLRAMFAAVDAVLREHPEVGAYNQTI